MIDLRRVEARLESVGERWKALLDRVSDPALFNGLERDEAIRWFSYLFSIPAGEQGRPQARTHVLALYDPFARRSVFPAGIRFSCNV